ncbi:hypothetical protein DITRI_Ditri12bG0070200 [Diplodiscus trichospermus]
MRVLYLKMKRLKGCLKVFNKEYFGGITARVADKRKELEIVQYKILSNEPDLPKEELLTIEGKLTSELQHLMDAEECFFKQKSGIT